MEVDHGCCFVTDGSGAFEKIDGIMNSAMDQNNLVVSAKKFRPGRRQSF